MAKIRLLFALIHTTLTLRFRPRLLADKGLLGVAAGSGKSGYAKHQKRTGSVAPATGLPWTYCRLQCVNLHRDERVQLLGSRSDAQSPIISCNRLPKDGKMGAVRRLFLRDGIGSPLRQAQGSLRAIGVALFICALPLTASAQGIYYRNEVRTTAGPIVTGAQVTICTSADTNSTTIPCPDKASIYADSADTVAAANPITADSNGNYSFYAPPGTYWVTVTGTGIQSQAFPLSIGGTGLVNAGAQYSLGQYSLPGTQATIGPTNISTDSTGSNLFIKGPTPWADITQNGARAVALSDTVTGSGSTITVTSTAWKNGDGIAIGPGGSSSTLTTPAAPTVSTGEAETDTTPDAILAAGATGSSTYNYCVFALDKLGHATVCSPVTTITNGPASLGPQQFTLSSASLTGSTLTYVTTVANGLLANAKVHITGLNTNTLYLNGWFPVTTVTNTTTDVTSGTPAYSASMVSATSGTLTYFVGNKVTWSAITGAWEYGVCAERPGDVSYHIIGYSFPVVSSGLGNPLQFVDWGSTFGAVAPFWTISDANCTNASPTNAIYSGTVTGGGGTTTLSISPALSNPVTSATAHQDSTPGIIAAANTALSSGYSAVFIPPNSTAYQVYSPLSLPANVKVLASGNLFAYAPVFMTNADSWQSFGKGSQSAPQFAYVGGAAISCAISPCLQTGYSGTSGSYQNIDRLTVGAPANGIACVIDNGSVSQGNDYYGLNCVTAGGSSDNAGMPVYFTGGLTSFRFSLFLAGGASDTTWTPGFYNAGGGLVTFEHVHWDERGYLANSSSDATARLNVADMYRQGGIEPYIEFENTAAALDTVGANIIHADGDTERQPTVTLTPVGQSIVGSVVLGNSVAGATPAPWRVTGGYEHAGAYTIPCPEIAQYGPPNGSDNANINVCSGALNASLPVVAPHLTDSSLTPSASPICPNGTGGAFTTTGCTSGSGTVTDGTGTTTANELLASTTTAHTYNVVATLPTAAMPALTGDVNNSAGSLATSVLGLHFGATHAVPLCNVAPTTNYVLFWDNTGGCLNWQAAASAASLPWSSLTAPTGNLSLNMTTDTTTFTWANTATDWLIGQTTAATNLANQSSPGWQLFGTYWTGTASANDTWTWQDVLGSGTNPTSTLTLTHGGSTGAAVLSVPGLSTSGSNGGISSNEGTCASITPAPASGVDTLCPNLTAHAWEANNNNAGYLPITETVASGTATMGTAAVSADTCATVVTVAATGVATTDTIQFTPNVDMTGVTGYGPSASGALSLTAYPTAGNVNFKVCNYTSGSITPSATALVLNWRVVR